MVIGIFDSSLGGLTILASKQKQSLDLSVIYLRDNKLHPKGCVATMIFSDTTLEHTDFV